MRFSLLEGERYWCGAQHFYAALLRLDICLEPYLLPLPHIFSSGELKHYVASIQNELRCCRPGYNEDYQYINRICHSLLKWADDGLIVLAED